MKDMTQSARDVLTKKWTDWVDYWAVDFDYESRKEIIKVERGTGISGVQGDLSGLSPAQRALELQAQPELVDQILGDGAAAARRRAEETMREVRARMGFLPAPAVAANER